MFRLAILLATTSAQYVPRFSITPSEVRFNETYTFQEFHASMSEPIICPSQDRDCMVVLDFTVFEFDPRVNVPASIMWNASANFDVWLETRNFSLTYSANAACGQTPIWEPQTPWTNDRDVFLEFLDTESELYKGFNPTMNIFLPVPVNCSGIDVAFIESLLSNGTLDKALDDAVSTVMLVVIILVSVFGSLCLCCGSACIYVWFDRKKRQNSLIVPVEKVALIFNSTKRNAQF